MTKEEINRKQREYRKRTNNAGVNKYRKTLNGLITFAYNGMLQRVSGRHKKYNHLYLGLPILSNQEFREWALNSSDLKRLYDIYINNGRELRIRPSIDRVDPKKGYTLDNMRWIPQYLNSSIAVTNYQKSIALKLEGKVYGKLTVLYRKEEKNKVGGYVWVCKCECGNLKEVAAAQLNIGNTKSCGCLKIAAAKAIKERRRYKVRCINDGKEFNSISEAASNYNINTGRISEILYKKRDNINGLKFEYQ